MKEEQYFYQTTKYPNIFKNVYWGNFSTKGEDEEELRRIGENRDAFVEEFSIKSLGNEAFFSRRVRLFDHTELYKCETGYVWITSPYFVNDKILDHVAFHFGFMKYKNLYSFATTTYLIKFSDKYMHNRFVKIINTDIARYLKKVEEEHEETQI